MLRASIDKSHHAARGVVKAKEYGFADDDYRYTREKSNLFLLHDLVITKIHLMLELATRTTAHKLIAWEQRRSVLLDWTENGRGRLSVNPDALFGLKDRRKPEGENSTYFFLEIVRSRESDYQEQQSYFMRKMEAKQLLIRDSPPEAALAVAVGQAKDACLARTDVRGPITGTSSLAKRRMFGSASRTQGCSRASASSRSAITASRTAIQANSRTPAPHGRGVASA